MYCVNLHFSHEWFSHHTTPYHLIHAHLLCDYHSSALTLCASLFPALYHQLTLSKLITCSKVIHLLWMWKVNEWMNRLCLCVCGSVSERVSGRLAAQLCVRTYVLLIVWGRLEHMDACLSPNNMCSLKLFSLRTSGMLLAACLCLWICSAVAGFATMFGVS